ncbi:MAG: Na+/H+ antiporter subunit E [Spirochaetales bacterium]|nr:Na+/H+ antiporter subunit E [Spirochaetales bacterium]
MDKRRAWALARIGIGFVPLFMLWVAFSASLDAFSLVAGACGSLLVAVLTRRVFIADHEASLRSFLPHPLGLALYLARLVAAMYASSARLLPVAFSGRCAPRVVHFRTRLKSDLGRALLANAVTFTPGTITLDLNDDHLIVHWLTATTRHSRAAGETIKGGLEQALSKALS